MGAIILKSFTNVLELLLQSTLENSLCLQSYQLTPLCIVLNSKSGDSVQSQGLMLILLGLARLL